MAIEVKSELLMREFGERLGRHVRGREMIELVGDVGSGKTTLVKGIASGMGVDDDVQSPSFTINRVYEARDSLVLSHYDFYRLNDPGIMANELEETTNDDATVTVIEWGGAVDNVLPKDRLTIEIEVLSETLRKLNITASGPSSARLRDNLS